MRYLIFCLAGRMMPLARSAASALSLTGTGIILRVGIGLRWSFA